jgi:hypothetical protein
LRIWNFQGPKLKPPYKAKLFFHQVYWSGFL